MIKTRYKVREDKVFIKGEKRIFPILSRGLVLDEDGSFDEEDMKRAYPHRWEKNISDLEKRGILIPQGRKKKEVIEDGSGN